jgi:tripartite-type tricarboxylate transporter receptor subunit TctC
LCLQLFLWKLKKFEFNLNQKMGTLRLPRRQAMDYTTRFTRRHILQAGAAFSALAGNTLMSPQALAQSPAVARLLIGAPPGGAGDNFLRKLADKMRGGFATSVIVENKPGAGGQIALMATRDAVPDGTTMLMTPSTFFSVYPHTYPKLPYKPDTDFAPVSLLAFTNFGLAVGRSCRIR